VEPDAPQTAPASVELPTARTVAAVAALGDELRRRMYEFIRGAAHPVSRDQAAAAAGISRKLAAFHLDKLVEVGLLHADVAEPGAVRRVGRRPKVYRSGDSPVRVSIPTRSPDLLVGILVEALDPSTAPSIPTDRDGASGGVAAGEQPADRVAAVAHRRGRELGAAERDRTRPGRLGAERGLTAAAAVLSALGFEPRRDRPTEVTLRNCPFEPHAADAPQLVCALNHALVRGLLEGLRADTVTATLTPRPGECCVQLTGPPS
jgi:predicted ArsR family transcriptional regulator